MLRNIISNIYIYIYRKLSSEGVSVFNFNKIYLESKSGD